MFAVVQDNAHVLVCNRKESGSRAIDQVADGDWPVDGVDALVRFTVETMVDEWLLVV